MTINADLITARKIQQYESQGQPESLLQLDKVLSYLPTKPESRCMNINANMIQLLRCPESGSALQPLEAENVESLNQAIRDGKLVNRMGKSIVDELEGALVNESRTWVYTVRSGIVSLIQDEAISYQAIEG